MLGDKIKSLREQRNMGVNELARKAHMNASYISAIERNEKTNPSTKILCKLADALDVSVEVFFVEIEFPEIEELELLDEKNNKEGKNILVKTNHHIIDRTKKKARILGIIPEEFTDPEEARAYISKHRIFSSEGFDVDKLTDENVLEFGNDLLNQMKMVSYKYKK